jgi:nucleotide-binding universal stress UspA family protein
LEDQIMPYQAPISKMRASAEATFLPALPLTAGAVRREEPEVLACIDDGENRVGVARHAVALAKALSLKLSFAHVLEIDPHGERPSDPIEWHLKLTECREGLAELIAQEAEDHRLVEPFILSGAADKKLNEWASRHPGSLLVLSKHGEQPGLGRTARQLLDRSLASVLLIPPANADECRAEYRRLLVPLDGSPNSESVLPIVSRIALAQHSEVILAHVDQVSQDTPAGFTKILRDGTRPATQLHWTPPDRDYFDKWQSRLAHQGITAAIHYETAGDASERLHALASRMRIDLMIVSSHGRSNVASVPYGAVTAALVQRATCPTLVVRRELRLTPVGDASSLRDRHAAPSGGELVC